MCSSSPIARWQHKYHRHVMLILLNWNTCKFSSCRVDHARWKITNMYLLLVYCHLRYSHNSDRKVYKTAENRKRSLLTVGTKYWTWLPVLLCLKNFGACIIWNNLQSTISTVQVLYCNPKKLFFLPISSQIPLFALNRYKLCYPNRKLISL